MKKKRRTRWSSPKESSDDEPRRYKKKKVKSHKTSLSSALLPLSSFISSPSLLIENALESLDWALVESMLPPFLQNRSKEDIISLMTEELKTISRRKILNIIDGHMLLEEEASPPDVAADLLVERSRKEGTEKKENGGETSKEPTEPKKAKDEDADGLGQGNSGSSGQNDEEEEYSSSESESSRHTAPYSYRTVNQKSLLAETKNKQDGTEKKVVLNNHRKVIIGDEEEDEQAIELKKGAKTSKKIEIEEDTEGEEEKIVVEVKKDTCRRVVVEMEAEQGKKRRAAATKGNEAREYAYGEFESDSKSSNIRRTPFYSDRKVVIATSPSPPPRPLSALSSALDEGVVISDIELE